MLLAERTDIILFLCELREVAASTGDCVEPVMVAVPSTEDAPEGGIASMECGRGRKTPVVFALGLGIGSLGAVGSVELSTATYCEKCNFSGPNTLSITLRGELLCIALSSFPASGWLLLLLLSFLNLGDLDLAKVGGLKSGGV